MTKTPSVRYLEVMHMMATHGPTSTWLQMLGTLSDKTIIEEVIAQILRDRKQVK